MDRALLSGVLAVVAVVIVGLLLRRVGRDETTPVPRPADDDAPDTAEADAREAGAAEDEADDLEEVEVAAVTSDGFALVPDAHAVRLVPPPDEGEGWKAGTTGHSPRGARALEMSWHAGDFTGGRVVRGAADEGPWRFEGLGRDGEYTAFVFETREGADAALALYRSRGVIRLAKDEEGHEVPPSPEQFEESRRLYLETEAALEQGDDEGH